MQQLSPQQISYNFVDLGCYTKFVGGFVVASEDSVVASEWWDQDAVVFEKVLLYIQHKKFCKLP